MQTFLRNLIFSLKLLRKEPAFTVTALLTLALCIGANSAVFSSVNALMFRPLPFDEPDRLVAVYNSYPRAEAPRLGVSVPDYFARRSEIEAFEEVAVFAYGGLTVGEEGKPEREYSVAMSPSLLPLLRIEPVLGRTFTEEETEPENARVIILGYDYWTEHFDRDETVLGRTLRVDGHSYTIVGVLPEGFRLLDQRRVDLFVPTAFTPEARSLENLHSLGLTMIARLLPGATIELATEQIAALDDRLLDAWPVPDGRRIIEETGFHTEVVDLHEALLGDRRPTFILLLAGVGLVLLIGCVNIAHLMTTRLNVRQLELATRIALGANRRQLYTQVLTEGLVIAVLGGLLSLLVASGGLSLMRLLRVDELPFGFTIQLDLTVLSFTLLVSVLAGCFFGLLPVSQILRTDLHPVFRYDGRSVTVSRRTMRTRNLMAVLQVALAFVLLIGAGLLVLSFSRLLRIDPGFEDPASLLHGFIDLPESRYPDDASRRRFTDEFLVGIRSLPGVRDAAVTSRLPFVTFEATTILFPEGYELRTGESLIAHRFAVVSPGYFQTMGIPLLLGRDFSAGDTEDAPNVIIIDEWLAQHYWPGENPIGRRLRTGSPAQEPDSEDDFYSVIGVVGSVRYADLAEPAAGGRGAFYLSYRQASTEFMVPVLRTDLEPLALVQPVQERLNGIDPDLPFYFPTAYDERMTDSTLERRIPMVLIIIFALLALFLAAVGLFGVLAYGVTQRTRELGIRLAVGSSPAEIFRLIITDGLRILIFGLGIGIPVAVVLLRIIRTLLFAVAPTNIFVFGSVVLLITMVTLLAGMIPARRATRIDPVQALKHE